MMIEERTFGGRCEEDDMRELRVFILDQYRALVLWVPESKIIPSL